jgi:hypothetical protein
MKSYRITVYTKESGDQLVYVQERFLCIFWFRVKYKNEHHIWVEKFDDIEHAQKVIKDEISHDKYLKEKKRLNKIVKKQIIYPEID